MKVHRFFPGIFLSSLVIFALGTATTSAAVKAISGVVRITNTDADILARLDSPGNEGMTEFIVSASTGGAFPVQASSDVATTNYLTNPYSFTVPVTATPSIFHVNAAIYLDGGYELFFTETNNTPPLSTGSLPATVNFNECVALVELRYQLSDGTPVFAIDSRATVTETAPPYTVRAQYGGQLPGNTNNFLVVPSGVPLDFAIEVDVGTNIYSDRIRVATNLSMTLACDAKPVVLVIFPTNGALGTIRGNVNMVGEIEVPTDGYGELLSRPVIIASRPMNNQRYAAFAAEFPGPDTNRLFTLENLVPSVATQAWSLHAEMQFRTGDRFEYFRSPGLGEGTNNPGATVLSGQTNNLGNTFVMHPAKLVGNITLTGPPEFGNNVSALRGVIRSSDLDTNLDLIPDGVGLYGINGSFVAVLGLDELTPGASLTAAGAYAAASMAGTFNPGTSAFEGDYEVLLGTLNDQPGLWYQYYVNFAITNSGANDAPYVNQVFYIADNLAWQGALAPGQRATNDLNYGLAEVCLRINSATPFYNPRVIGAYGTQYEPDYNGSNRSYSVYVASAYGQPETAAGATTSSVLTFYVPEGDYTFQPIITTVVGGVETDTTLDSLDLKVYGGERLCVDGCVQVRITPPVCTTNYGFLTYADAFACTATLTNLSLNSAWLGNTNIRLGYSDIRILQPAGMPRTNLHTVHGLFPEYDGYQNHLEYYNDILHTAVARDTQGRVATAQFVSHYDFTPPTINCPSDVIVDAVDAMGSPVTYTVTATDDRPGPVKIVCTPPSESLFPIGTSYVTCYASDLCRNTNTCTFRVIVRDVDEPLCPLDIVAAQLSPLLVTLSWNCSGILQSSPNPDGPWIDEPEATTPYTIPGDILLRKFFRLRFNGGG